MKRELMFGGIAGLSGWLLTQIASVIILQTIMPDWFGQILVPIFVGIAACALVCAQNAKYYVVRIAVAAPVFVVFGFFVDVAPMIAAGGLPIELAKLLARATTVYGSFGFLAGILLAFPVSALLFIMRQKKIKA